MAVLRQLTGPSCAYYHEQGKPRKASFTEFCALTMQELPFSTGTGNQAP
jgi:hypothetical protein